MNNQPLKSHYDAMWENAVQKFYNQQIEADELINSAKDDRNGMTLLARPSNLVKENIRRFLEDIRELEPHQYYYPEPDIHLTILSIISCYSGFRLEQINPSKYHEIINENIKQIKPIHIRFKGITASPSGILIQGFPENNGLEKLRNRLRSALKNSTLKHSVDKRYVIKTAHLTVFRFMEPVNNVAQFISTISRYRNYEFGKCCIDELELVGNNWYQQNEQSRLLHNYKLQM